MAQSIFREASLERLSSPEQLNDYIKVTSPSVWFVFTAVAVLLAAVLFWAATGTLPTHVDTVAQVEDGQLVCYLSTEDAATVSPGMEVTLSTGETGTVASLDDMPLSRSEASAQIDGDYAIETMGISDWNIRAVLDVDGSFDEDSLHQASITTDEVSPISFLLDGQGASA